MTLAPGGTIGILGGGQLGRMTAMAAARLGYRCRILAPEADAPAADVAPCERATYDDRAALERFAAAVDVVTLEFENVPVASLEWLAARVPVHPGASVLAVTQDRLQEKAFVNAQGIATAPWAPVTGTADMESARERIPGDAILKSARLGYDGKGQARLAAGESLGPAWEGLGGGDCVLEGLVRFKGEVSVIVARSITGEVAAYPPVANRHEDGILRETSVPSGLDAAEAKEAVAIAVRLANGLDVVGLLAVEMFLEQGSTLLVNELAPRPHNSGHWSLDAAPVSQFEQLIRAVAGLPLGDPTPFAAARMVNMLGDEADGWQDILADPAARLHLYGKREARAWPQNGARYIRRAQGRLGAFAYDCHCRNDAASHKNLLHRTNSPLISPVGCLSSNRSTIGGVHEHEIRDCPQDRGHVAQHVRQRAEVSISTPMSECTAPTSRPWPRRSA